MKTVSVKFSRTYSVDVEVDDNYDPEDVEEIARDMVIDAEHLYSSQLECDGIEDQANDEEETND